MLTELPTTLGAYVLQLHLDLPVRQSIGKLGDFFFPAGGYFYVGSAAGPGGLRARLGRHIAGGAHRHWHIDYFRPSSRVIGLLYLTATSKLTRKTLNEIECGWSRAIARLPGATIPAPGFGASDCPSACPAHLVAFPACLPDMPVAALSETAAHIRAVIHFEPLPLISSQ